MLFSKSHFAVRHAASKDATRYNLNGVHCLPDGSTVATDGHRLMRAWVETPKAEDFPSVNGFMPAGDDELQPFTLPLDTIDRVVKAIPDRKAAGALPILQHAILDVKATNGNGKARFLTTDRESVQEIEGRKIEGEFPQYKQVIPDEKNYTRTVAFNLSYVGDFLKACREFGATRSMLVKLDLQDDTLAPMRLTFENPDIGKLEMILMPMRTK